MQVGKPIYWHEGLFLRPQHFQQLDEYCRHSIHSRFGYSEPYQWGVNSLSLVQAAVRNNIVEISELDLLFEDGTQVMFPGNCKIRSRNVSELWDGTGRPLSIYLAIPKKKEGKNNVSIEPKQAQRELPIQSKYDVARYSLSAQGSKVADYYSDDKYNRLLFLDYQLEILVNEEVLGAVDYHVIKIAELVMLSAVVQISSEYIPPVINIQSNTYLKEITRNCLEQVVSVIRRLKRHDQNSEFYEQIINSNSSYLSTLLVFQTLNRYRPLLENCIQNPTSTPYALYLYLRQFISELSTFSRGRLHNDTTQKMEEEENVLYQHDSLFPIISTLTKQLSDLINDLVSEPEYAVRLTYDGTYFSIKLENIHEILSGTAYLAINVSVDEARLVHTVECLTKLSSKEQLPLMITRSINTTDLEYQSNPDYRLERKTNVYYFKINKDGLAWEAIKEDKNLAVYLGASIPHCAMDLVIIYE